MFYLFQNFNFIFQKFTTMILHITYLHNLQGYDLTLIVVFVTLINCTAESTSNNVRQTVTIRPYSLLTRLHLNGLLLSWWWAALGWSISFWTGIILTDGICVGNAHLSHSNKYNVKTKNSSNQTYGLKWWTINYKFWADLWGWMWWYYYRILDYCNYIEKWFGYL